MGGKKEKKSMANSSLMVYKHYGNHFVCLTWNNAISVSLLNKLSAVMLSPALYIVSYYTIHSLYPTITSLGSKAEDRKIPGIISQINYY